jgi:hypothetical protein
VSEPGRDGDDAIPVSLDDLAIARAAHPGASEARGGGPELLVAGSMDDKLRDSPGPLAPFGSSDRVDDRRNRLGRVDLMCSRFVDAPA